MVIQACLSRAVSWPPHLLNPHLLNPHLAATKTEAKTAGRLKTITNSSLGPVSPENNVANIYTSTLSTAERLPSNSDSGILTPRGNVNLANSQWKHRSSYLQRLSKYPEVVEVPDYRFLCIRRNLAVICLTDPGVQNISCREYPTCERCYYPRR
jgi:hypothetical protein